MGKERPTLLGEGPDTQQVSPFSSSSTRSGVVSIFRSQWESMILERGQTPTPSQSAEEATVKIGIMLNSQFAPGAHTAAAFRETLEQVRVMRDLGFDSVWVGQHYLSTPYQMWQPMAVLARLSAEAGRMTVGTNIFLLTLHNPVESAELAATLDVITYGRFVFGVGLGYRPEEFDAFGIPLAGRATRFEELFTAVGRLLSGEEVTMDGRYVCLARARMTIAPVQKPRPPIWLAATGDRAVARAARMADAWVINPVTTVPTLVQQTAVYRQALAAAGKAAPAEQPIMREIAIGRTTGESLDRARPWLEPKYAAYAGWGLDKPVGESDGIIGDFESMARDRFIWGSPADCRTEIERYRQELGANHFILRLQWPGMPQREALRSLELVGSELLPAVRARHY
jgi:alkanesulfonate monooxygenase SsuD/methylene tetrahydromethanopterin reductase-like flavin-dependent oxidoreductase (luciferase family)